MSHPRVKSEEQIKQEADNFFQKALRGIGNGLGTMDDAYAKFIRQQVGGLKDDNLKAIQNMSGFDATRASFGQFAGAKRNQTMFDTDDPSYNKTLDNILRGSVVTGRYVVPAAGVTGAGYGLMALANHFGGTADEPTDSQLYM